MAVNELSLLYSNSFQKMVPQVHTSESTGANTPRRDPDGYCGTTLHAPEKLSAAQSVSVAKAADLLSSSVTTGIAAWEFETGSPVYASPCVGPDGTAYVGGSDGKLCAVKKDGSTLWECMLGDGRNMMLSSPCLGPDGTVYAGYDDGKLYAVKDGTILWGSRLQGGVIHSSPCLGSDGMIYVGGRYGSEGGVYALRAEDGEIIWNYPTGGAVDSSPCLDAD